MTDRSMKDPAVSLIGSRCTGCEACVQICPAQALSMEMDGEGFFYPAVDPDCCTRCGICARACPAANPKAAPKHPLPGTAYAGSHKRRDILFSSASGGAFSAIIAAAEPDAVYGTAWIAPGEAGCVRVPPGAAQSLRRSKYVQGRVGSAFRQVRQDLEEGRRVLFGGTPCQIAGLLSFLDARHTDQDGLTAVEIICHGIASPGAFRRYCDMRSLQYRSPVTDFIFRKKSPGQGAWEDFHASVKTANGKQHSIRRDLFTVLFLARLLSRPSCAVCPFCAPERAGDLLIGDYWGCGQHDPELYNKYGVSVVFPLTKRGQALIPPDAGVHGSGGGENGACRRPQYHSAPPQSGGSPPRPIF